MHMVWCIRCCSTDVNIATRVSHKSAGIDMQCMKPPKETENGCVRAQKSYLTILTCATNCSCNSSFLPSYSSFPRHPYMIDMRTNPGGEEYLAYNQRRWGSDGWTQSLRRYYTNHRLTQNALHRPLTR